MPVVTGRGQVGAIFLLQNYKTPIWSGTRTTRQTSCVLLSIIITYRIYSINRPGNLLNFWTLRVGAYSRWALIRGWELIKFSPFSASEVCLFCNKTINANNKTRRCNKATFLQNTKKNSVFGEVSY